jgi:hypothetical protein
VLTAEEGDYKTAFSYFFEGFEQYSALGEPKALPLLKYMLLCKIMMSEVKRGGGRVYKSRSLSLCVRTHVAACCAAQCRWCCGAGSLGHNRDPCVCV